MAQKASDSDLFSGAGGSHGCEPGHGDLGAIISLSATIEKIPLLGITCGVVEDTDRDNDMKQVRRGSCGG